MPKYSAQLLGCITKTNLKFDINYFIVAPLASTFSIKLDPSEKN